MASDLGFIDVENNDLPDLGFNLGKIKGTFTGSGVLDSLFNSNVALPTWWGKSIDRIIEKLDNVELSQFVLTNNFLISNTVDVLISIEQAQLTGGDGDNLLNASKFTLGSVTLDGASGDDTIYGGSKNDRLIGGDGFGFDYLDGGKGADTMIGGDGGDQYIVDNLGDIVIDTGTSYDIVNSFVTFTLSNTLEELNLKGSAAIDGTGNKFANIITGNKANNTLTGMGGDDTLDGGKERYGYFNQW